MSVTQRSGPAALLQLRFKIETFTCRRFTAMSFSGQEKTKQTTQEVALATQWARKSSLRNSFETGDGARWVVRVIAVKAREPEFKSPTPTNSQT